MKTVRGETARNAETRGVRGLNTRGERKREEEEGTLAGVVVMVGRVCLWFVFRRAVCK